MKRVILAVMSGLLLSCQGPAAVLAHEAAPTAAPVLAKGPEPAIRARWVKATFRGPADRSSSTVFPGLRSGTRNPGDRTQVWNVGRTAASRRLDSGFLSRLRRSQPRNDGGGRTRTDV